MLYFIKSKFMVFICHNGGSEYSVDRPILLLPMSIFDMENGSNKQNAETNEPVFILI